MSDNNRGNSDPKIWGPLMWGILYSIAQHSDKFNSVILNNLIAILPSILPCTKCQNSCRKIYEQFKMSRTDSAHFRQWVWRLRTEVDRELGKQFMSFDEFANTLNSNAEFTNVDLILQFIGILKNTIPSCKCSNQAKKNHIQIFVYNLLELSKNIEYIETLQNHSDYIYSGLKN
jgi:hypothetical protein